jgi:lysophospholipase L1-like esterase
MMLIAVALIALLEVGLRLYMGSPAFHFDEARIAALTPSSSKAYLRSVDGGPRIIRWHTNEQGFRGPELRDSPSKRVIVYGDSNVQARFSVQAETFTGQLEALLGERSGDDIEVLNAGVVGYGPDQNLLRLEDDIERYEPDAVVFHLFTENDFGDIVRNRLFALDPDGNLIRTRHPVTPDARMPKSAWSRPSGPLLQNLMINLFAEAFFRGRARSAQPHPELEHDPEGFREKRLRQHAREFAVYANDAPRKYSMFSDHYEADIAFEPEGESAQTKRALLTAVVEEAAAVAAEHGVTFLVVIQPTSRDLTTNLPNHHRALAGIEGYDRRRLDRWAAEICETAGVDFINLFDVFAATGEPNELYFPTPDPHWNEAGQRVAAEATAARLAPVLR